MENGGPSPAAQSAGGAGGEAGCAARRPGEAGLLRTGSAVGQWKAAVGPGWPRPGGAFPVLETGERGKRRGRR